MAEHVFSSNALSVLEARYIKKGADGNPIETIPQMFERIAFHVGDETNRDVFFKLISEMQFVPNSPTFTGAGKEKGQLAACFVLPIEDDMGRRDGGIFNSLRDASLIQQSGGGNGFSFSRLRPSETLVLSSMGKATGPLGFLKVYDAAFGEIAQGGSRRGANMAVLRVDHPDIMEFIRCKDTEGNLTNFNISVGITDAFMRAVLEDADWDLVFPDVTDPKYRDFSGTIEDAIEQGIAIKTYKTLKARDVFAAIVEQAWKNGEPGLLFLDTAQRDNPTPSRGRYESTNPCGEQPLLPYENCCLGSVNLTKVLTKNEQGEPSINWKLLAEIVHKGVAFLDSVVTRNAYVDTVPKLREAAMSTRRIGLGIMGLADVLYHMRVSYSSKDGRNLAAQIIEYCRYHAMLTSIKLAKDKGAFPGIKESIYDPDNLKWTPPQKPEWFDGDYRFDKTCPTLNWDIITEGIREHGIRNATQLTIAPTGTIATVAGVEGYGCEPVFALSYKRNVSTEDGERSLRYDSPLFIAALEEEGLNKDEIERIMQEVAQRGSCQGVDSVPLKIQDVFVVSSDISAKDHVRMQATLQAFTDAAISKTINFPQDATREDVATAFKLAWSLKCKGITVYIAGSRQSEVLEVKKEPDTEMKTDEVPGVMTAPTKVRTRPQVLEGSTYRVRTPLGTAYVVVNEDEAGEPFEMFLNIAKAGSDTAAVAEALARLISLLLRIPSAMTPTERLEEIELQLAGIGGGRPLGFGHNRVLSLPDGVAQAIKQHLIKSDTEKEVETEEPQSVMFGGDLCPSCGQAAMVYTEGCSRCYSCGHSEC